jgi:hypothetical protein
VYCAHTIALWTKEMGSEFAIPGFVCDPSWVRLSVIKSGTRYWPHAMNVNGVVNDLTGFIDQGCGVSATHYHGWLKACWSTHEVMEWREAHGLHPEWWSVWHQEAQRSKQQGILCHNCNFPYVKYGRGMWFLKSDAGGGCERGFCVNLACPESLFSGHAGPGQLVAESFVRFGLPWDPRSRPHRSMRSCPGPPGEVRHSRRDLEREFHAWKSSQAAASGSAQPAPAQATGSRAEAAAPAAQPSRAAGAPSQQSQPAAAAQPSVVPAAKPPPRSAPCSREGATS